MGARCLSPFPLSARVERGGRVTPPPLAPRTLARHHLVLPALAEGLLVVVQLLRLCWPRGAGAVRRPLVQRHGLQAASLWHSLSPSVTSCTSPSPVGDDSTQAGGGLVEL